MSCNKAMKAASVHEAQRINSYIAEAKNAVGDLIGFKSDGVLKAAEANNKANPNSFNKQKLKNVKRQVKEHNELFDILVNDMIENGQGTNWNKSIANPSNMAENWSLSLSKALKGEITPVTIRQGLRTIRSVKVFVKRVQLKRKVMMSKGISKAAIWGSPPEFVLGKADRFGFAQKLVKKALTSSDRTISVTSKFGTKISSSRQTITDKISSLLSDSKNKAMFNLNNISLWGINEEADIGFRLTTGDKNGNRKDEDVSIVGETVINGVEYFKVKFIDSGEIITTEATNLGASREDINKSIVSLYRDNVTNELMDGQLRLIIPSVINKEIKTIEDGAGVTSEEDSNYGRIKAKIRKMTESKDSTLSENPDETGNRVGGIHTITKKIDGVIYRYRYMMVKNGEGKNIRSQKGKAPNMQESYNAFLLDKVKIGTNAKPIESTRINYVGKTYKSISGGDIEASSQNYTQEEADIVFGKEKDSEGVWVRSEQVNDFGRRLSPINSKKYKKGDPIDGTHTKQYVNFKKLEKGLPDKLMPIIWDSVADLREINNSIFEDLKSKSQKIEKKVALLISKIEAKLIKKV